MKPDFVKYEIEKKMQDKINALGSAYELQVEMGDCLLPVGHLPSKGSSNANFWAAHQSLASVWGNDPKAVVESDPVPVAIRMAEVYNQPVLMFTPNPPRRIGIEEERYSKAVETVLNYLCALT